MTDKQFKAIMGAIESCRPRIKPKGRKKEGLTNVEILLSILIFLEVFQLFY
jgi:hypothetical protein